MNVVIQRIETDSCTMWFAVDLRKRKLLGTWFESRDDVIEFLESLI